MADGASSPAPTFGTRAPDPSTMTLTPEQMAQRRALANAMLKAGMDYGPIQSPWQGAARVAQALMGGWEEHSLEQQQSDAMKAGQAAWSDALSGAFGGAGSAPATGQSAPQAASMTPASSSGAGPDMSQYQPMFSAAEQKYGLPAGYLSQMASIESSGNPNAVSPTGARGLFQFTGDTAKAYGLSDPTDPTASTDAAARLAVDNAKYLTAALGRPPTAGELYLAHQEGAQGAAQLLTHPDAAATDVVDSRNLVVNGYKPGMTAGQFASQWTSRFGNQPTMASNTGAASPLAPPGISGAAVQPQPNPQVASADPNFAPQTAGTPQQFAPGSLNGDQALALANQGANVPMSAVAMPPGPQGASAPGPAPNATAPGPVPLPPVDPRTQAAYADPAAGGATPAAAPMASSPAQQAIANALANGPAPKLGAVLPISQMTEGSQKVAAAAAAAGGLAPATAATSNLSPKAQAVANAMLGPDQVQKLAAVMANPWVPDSEKSLLVGVLQQRMRPIEYGFETLPDGTIVRTNPRAGTVEPIYQGPMKPLIVNDRVLDPRTMKPLYQPPVTQGFQQVNGRLVATNPQTGTATDVTPPNMPSGYRFLSPQEKQQLGYPADTPVQVGPDGKVVSNGITINTGTPQSQYSDEMAKGLSGPHMALENGVEGAQEALRDVHAMQGALARIQQNSGTTGLGQTEITKLQSVINTGANALGIDQPYDIADKEFMTKFNRQIAGAQAKALGGARVTNFELNNVLQSNPGLEMSPTGNARLLGIQAQTLQRGIDLGQQIRQVTADAVSRGAKVNPAQIEQLIRNYDSDPAHHIKDPVTGQDLTENMKLPEFQPGAQQPSQAGQPPAQSSGGPAPNNDVNSQPDQTWGGVQRPTGGQTPPAAVSGAQPPPGFPTARQDPANGRWYVKNPAYGKDPTQQQWFPAIQTPDEARKLPSGSRFMMPDGRIGTVP